LSSADGYEKIDEDQTGEPFLDTSPAREILEIRDLNVRYLPRGGKAVYSVKDVSLRISAAEVVGIIGESGSGKSTLAASILKLLPSNAESRAGSVLLEGRDVLAMRERELCEVRGARVAMVSQDPATSLNPVLKIGTQVSEVLRAHLSLNRKERKDRAVGLLQEVGFNDPERIYAAYPHELSGGQRQRVVIAQAIACRPALIIADEPTSKLDSQLQAEILALLADVVRRHKTALAFITHDPSILIGLADRIAVMYAGRIVEEGSTNDVVRNPLHPYTQSLLRLFAAADARNAQRTNFTVIAGEPADLTQIAPGCCFEPRCSERMEVCARQVPKELTKEQFHRVSCFKYGN
jgi:oligopeptide/dipeptide ABC transporter ATP-binding protein